MERIIEHIERLLLLHDCVIIPDFGGFVLQVIHAIYQEEDHSFTPARKEIVFNPTLTHNDGLLTESYMQRYEADFDKAMWSVRKDITELKERLNDDSELQFGTIGMFFKEDERLIFMPAKDSDKQFNAITYGLPVFHFLPISVRSPLFANSFITTVAESEITPKTALKHKQNVLFRIPVTRTFLQVAATTAAAILLFILFTTPVGDVNKSSYSASFVPKEIMPRKIADEINFDVIAHSDIGKEVVFSIGQPLNTSETPPIDNTASSKSSTAPTTFTSSTSASTSSTSRTSASKSSSSVGTRSGASSSVKPATASAATGGGKYYVIIASYKTRAQAQKHISQLKGTETANADILFSDGQMRVYAQNFTSKNEAQAYLAKIKKNPKHDTAWLYTAR